MNVRCFYCKEPVDPSSDRTWQQVTGWQHRSSRSSSRRGGSDISMRTPTGELAHDTCVNLAKRGISPAQGTLL